MCIELCTDDTTLKKAPEEPHEKPAKKRRWGSTKTSTTTDTTQAKTKRLSSIEFSTESLKVGTTFNFEQLNIFYTLPGYFWIFKLSEWDMVYVHLE